MSLKAVLFDLSGVIINDEAIHQELIAEILLGENLRPRDSEYKQFCLGRSDRGCLQDILASRGRLVSEEYITQLMVTKAQAYEQKLEQLENLPLYPHVAEFLTRLQEQNLSIGLVTGALRTEVELVLQRAEIAEYFTIMVTGDDLQVSKPKPDGYFLAIEYFNKQNPQLNLSPSECLAIEDSPVGIEAAKQAGIQVVGIANTFPLHMLQRQADWTVDNLLEIELDRVERIL
ncbi:HAD family phosphatase [Myxosarcina sp. GI1]|uniref:HAD family hydrolase n=1 Tax=Myxosarcina sp. GI1 TaxID=1541065 RepID=UPI00056A5C94|nr:HAD family phosphatase [Myxosarcina sp. GI1]